MVHSAVWHRGGHFIIMVTLMSTAARKLLCAALASLLLSSSGCKEAGDLARLPESSGSKTRKVRLTRVELTLDRDRIRATGTVDAPSTTKVMPLVPGLITRLNVKEGDLIRKGQVLAVIEPDPNQTLQLYNKRAAVERAQIDLEQIQKELARKEL